MSKRNLKLLASLQAAVKQYCTKLSIGVLEEDPITRLKGKEKRLYNSIVNGGFSTGETLSMLKIVSLFTKKELPITKDIEIKPGQILVSIKKYDPDEDDDDDHYIGKPCVVNSIHNMIRVDGEEIKISLKRDSVREPTLKEIDLLFSNPRIIFILLSDKGFSRTFKNNA
jgi:hypothetical protein